MNAEKENKSSEVSLQKKGYEYEYDFCPESVSEVEEEGAVPKKGNIEGEKEK